MLRKKDWAITLGTIAYSFLFYDQNAGLNFLLFTCLVVGLFIMINRSLTKNINWLIIAFFCLLSGVFVLFYGSSLAITANVVCLLLLSAAAVNSRSSVIFNLFYGVYSVVGSVVFMVINLINASRQNDASENKASGFRHLTYIVPVVLTIVFFFIYRNVNPLFEKYTNELNLDFITAAWFFFTLGGLFIVYGLFCHARIKEIDEWEAKQALNISHKMFGKGLWDEGKAAAALFILLNVMLIFINLLDVNYLYLGAGMPKGITHKEFVHNGVGMLILSILLGITVILYFFRGAMNFSGKNKALKLLVYFWLFQNLMMVIATGMRNQMYIDSALLTYKRIGVYYWLFMAAAGIFTTALKVNSAKTNWFLFKVNSYIAFVALVLSAGLDWDKYISNYNIGKSSLMSSLDKRYLISLSETNIAQLYNIKHKPGFSTDSLFHYQSHYRTSNHADLDAKLYQFLNNLEGTDWRSFSFRNNRVLKEIKELKNSGKTDSLDLSGSRVKTMKPFFLFDNLVALKMNVSDSVMYKDMARFNRLERLSVRHVEMKDVPYLSRLRQLKTLAVYGTSPGVITALKSEMPNTTIIEVKRINRFE